MHRDDTQSRTEWNVRITLFYAVTIQPERLRLQLFIKYPDTGKITRLFLKQKQSAVAWDPILSTLKKTFNVYFYYLQLSHNGCQKNGLQKLLTSQSGDSSVYNYNGSESPLVWWCVWDFLIKYSTVNVDLSQTDSYRDVWTHGDTETITEHLILLVVKSLKSNSVAVQKPLQRRARWWHNVIKRA